MEYLQSFVHNFKHFKWGLRKEVGEYILSFSQVIVLDLNA